MTTSQAQSNLNLPNVLTAIRIAVVPVFIWVLLAEDGTSWFWRCSAFVILVAAMITDKIDGDIARKRGLVTNFGKIADPIADKAITGAAFVGLSILGDIWWWVTIIVLLREWSVTILRLGMLKHVVIPAAFSGKLKTTFQAIALCGLCLPFPHGSGVHADAFAAIMPWGEWLFFVCQVNLVLAVALTMWSGYEFYRDAWRLRRKTGLAA
jgi:CDP-diacylglycerol---glycerol-3-phosphate 3-phosphatidyltransferase